MPTSLAEGTGAVETAVPATPDATPATEPAGGLDLADLYDQAYNEFESENSDSEPSQETDDTDVSVETSDEGHDDTDGVDTADTTDEWDWSTVASKPVTVKVNGEDIQVPFDELRNGYMRQADYTRKTQEVAESARLAEWARDFQDRWNNDPAGMIRILSAAAGPEVSQPQAPQPDPFEGLTQEYPELAPFAEHMRQQQEVIQQLSAQLEQVNQGVGMTQQEIAKQQSLELVKQEIAQVKSEFSDFDEMQALPIAAQLNVDLRTAYFILKGQGGATTPTVPAAGGQAPAAAAKPAPKPVNQAKKQATGTVTNSRATAEASMDEVEYDSFSELFDIVSKTEG